MHGKEVCYIKPNAKPLMSTAPRRKCILGDDYKLVKKARMQQEKASSSNEPPPPVRTSLDDSDLSVSESDFT